VRILLAILLVGAALQPAAAVMLKEGTIEVLVEGAFDFSNWKSEEELSLLGGLGYFVRDDIELGGFVSYQDVEFDSLWGIGCFAEYNQDFGLILLPFVGARITYFDGDHFDDDHFLLTLSAGIKWFLAETVAISTALNYEIATEDIFQKDGNWVNATDEFGGEGEYTATNIDIRAGIRCFF